jgi:hypothetical protein
MKRHIPRYETPEDFICPECGETDCKIVPNLNHFDYAGTHCTHGNGGTHYPSDWGYPVTDCCGADIDDAVSDEYCPDWARVCDDDGPDNRRDL